MIYKNNILTEANKSKIYQDIVKFIGEDTVNKDVRLNKILSHIFRGENATNNVRQLIYSYITTCKNNGVDINATNIASVFNTLIEDGYQTVLQNIINNQNSFIYNKNVKDLKYSDLNSIIQSYKQLIDKDFIDRRIRTQPTVMQKILNFTEDEVKSATDEQIIKSIIFSDKNANMKTSQFTPANEVANFIGRVSTNNYNPDNYSGEKTVKEQTDDFLSVAKKFANSLSKADKSVIWQQLGDIFK